MNYSHMEKIFNFYYFSQFYSHKKNLKEMHEMKSLTRPITLGKNVKVAKELYLQKTPDPGSYTELY